ncbi:MAG: hypothetical protein EOO73_35580 [Myxococcales bacterium]|nr:MAG: hypothetical protein EOO73_35580 [Myxococcales bacterium]
MPEPRIRANWAKFTVRCAKRAQEPLRTALLGAIPDALRSEIREAGSLQWLPARAFVELCEALRLGAGVTSARGFWRQSLREAIRQPFMQPLARGALFLWGKTPAALVRRTPQAWQLVSKDCGVLKAIESGRETSITLRVEELPAGCRKPGLLLMWEGGLMAQLDAVSTPGDVVVRAEQYLSAGAAELVLSWAGDAGRSASG